MAVKTGAPVIGIYDSIGGRLDEGADMLAAYGEVLLHSNNLSRVSSPLSDITTRSALAAIIAETPMQGPSTSAIWGTTPERLLLCSSTSPVSYTHLESADSLHYQTL